MRETDGRRGACECPWGGGTCVSVRRLWECVCILMYIFPSLPPSISIYGVLLSAAALERRTQLCVCVRVIRMLKCVSIYAAYVCVWLCAATAHVCRCVGGLGARL